jgi:hypothetical protein
MAGGEHADTVYAVKVLALVYWNRACWDKAESLFARALHTNMRLLDEQHPEAFSAKATMTAVYCNQGWWDKAANTRC